MARRTAAVGKERTIGTCWPPDRRRRGRKLGIEGPSAGGNATLFRPYMVRDRAMSGRRCLASLSRMAWPVGSVVPSNCAREGNVEPFFELVH